MGFYFVSKAKPIDKKKKKKKIDNKNVPALWINKCEASLRGNQGNSNPTVSRVISRWFVEAVCFFHWSRACSCEDYLAMSLIKLMSLVWAIILHIVVFMHSLCCGSRRNKWRPSWIFRGLFSFRAYLKNRHCIIFEDLGPIMYIFGDL